MPAYATLRLGSRKSWQLQRLDGKTLQTPRVRPGTATKKAPIASFGSRYRPHDVQRAGRYNEPKRICIAFRAMGAQMPDSYKELIKSNPDEIEIRSFLVNGDQVSVTLRIPDTLRDAAKEEAALRA